MEQIRRRQRTEESGRNYGTFDDADGAADAGVTVISGIHLETLPVAGMTVRQIRERMATRLDIDPRSAATIDGEDAEEGQVVRASQCLMFSHRVGAKGVVMT